MIVITQVQPIAVLFTIPEDSLPQVTQKLRAGAHLIVEAYNRDNSQKLASGRLMTLDNQIDNTTGTSKLKAVFDNKDNTLFPQQFVNIRLLVDTLEDQLALPNVAIQNGQQGTFVYVVDNQSKVHLKTVQVGITTETMADILGGISEGDRVVVDGTDRLSEGAKVRVRRAGEMDNPAGSEGGGGGGGGRQHRRGDGAPKGDASQGQGQAGSDQAPSDHAQGQGGGGQGQGGGHHRHGDGSGRKGQGGGDTPVSPSRTFILRPVATSLMMAGVVLIGIQASGNCRSRRCPRSITPPSRSRRFTLARARRW